MTRERPVLFSAPMVRSLLADRKTQTRRLLKWPLLGPSDGTKRQVFGAADLDRWHGKILACCPYGVPGDRLCVRETWAVGRGYDGVAPCDLPPPPQKTTIRLHHVADGPTPEWAGQTRVSIHMPRWASRITLEIAEVRVQRLRDISEEDAQAEGVKGLEIDGAAVGDSRGCQHGARTCCRCVFSLLWEQINGIGSWNENPFVWAVSLRRLAS